MPDQHVKKIVLPGGDNPFRSILVRLGIVAALILIAWAMLWAYRDGLKDAHVGPGATTPLDILYFAVVTVTTLGYGDIVPVSQEARAMVAFGITPLRIGIWLVLLSTAYEFALKSTIERIQMSRLKQKLKDHYVICGYGVKGEAAAQELLARGVDPHSIVVIEDDLIHLEQAAELGVIGIRGDATREETLRDASISTAHKALILIDDDRTCVLVCLTVRDMAPDVEILASAREVQNVKLIKQSGADTVVTPSVSGAKLLAASTVTPWSARIIEQFLDHEVGAEILDYPIESDDVGKQPSELSGLDGCLVLALHTHDDRMLSFRQARERTLEEGDTVIYFSPRPING